MVRNAARPGARFDATVFLACVAFSLLLRAANESVREGLAEALRRTVLAPLISLQVSAERTRQALVAHDGVVAQRDSMLLAASEVTALRSESERLRRLIGLASRLRWGFVPAEVLHQGKPGPQGSVLLSAGANQGVTQFSAVVSPDGLVGTVHSVDSNSSVATLWLDPSFAVSAMTEDRSAFGIVKPHTGSGADAYMLELRSVQFRYNLKAGTRIVATGEGGVFPEMLPIGTVVAELDTSTGWARTYLVRPVATPQDVKEVMILAPERSAAGVGDVWATRVQQDSTRRALIAAGDSLARLDYAARLKAEADSAKARLARNPPPPDTGARVIPPGTVLQ